jgi:hypothetical protein
MVPIDGLLNLLRLALVMSIYFLLICVSHFSSVLPFSMNYEWGLPRLASFRIM